MSILQIQFVLAGFCFGLWPLFMNKSGLSGILSSLVLTAVIVLLTLPFVTGELKNINNANWLMILGASIFATIGMIFFSKGLSEVTSQEVSSLFILLIVAQILVPTIYKLILSKGVLTTKQAFGFISAIVTAILLS